MNKTVCDICGKNTSDKNKYVLPMNCLNTIKANGYPISKFYTLKTTEVDLCDSCKTNLANVIDGLFSKEKT